MTTFFTRLLELGVHEMEEAEQEALFEIVQAEYFKRRKRPTDADHNHSKKEPKLMATQQTTDDQVFTSVFSLADSDLVPVDGSDSPVTVTVVDPTGADVSKWVNIQQDAANPLKFVYSRKSDTDGTQPQDLVFTAIGTALVNGIPEEFRSDLMFTPGVAKTLTALVTSGPAATPAPSSEAGNGEANQVP